MKVENESVEKLEIGKDYVNLHDNDVVVIDRVSDILNKGFERLVYKNCLSCSGTSNWREATTEEVIEAFENHLNHRFGEDWRTMKIKEKHPNSSSDINDDSWNVVIISKLSDGWAVWNKNGLLYRKGVWVERLEEEPKIHIKEAIKVNTVIHCETEEEAKRILGIAHELGRKWCTGENYENNTEWRNHKSKTCYQLIDGTYSAYDYFKNRNYYTIIPSTQIADLNDSEMSYSADKKRYEVIKTTFSDFNQLSLGDNKINKIVAHFVEHDEDTLLLAEKIAYILNLMEK